ncbi:NAD(P)-dependent oxidoreductase [Pseudonocardia charpentierae]|uniref:D-3-phosphoglycerate dehydrogenase n=1 Tax=Pseudonocardia charpentierae TaxID=3075545 RepID=A0ABU2NFM4_9PSEU|nr:NAD(P)-dependent oxidoreductase [Pseudonocardia sp. DSM 45834]MDT0352684.1 NAD(P)-dependent oxidoreductase [Pseudonocardia sp. DSM 45834]
MHLLFADSVADLTITELESRGHRCFVEPALTTAELPTRIAGVEGLVVRSTKVDRAVFDAADKLALVIRAGAGTNTIDVEAAARTGVLVSNVPGRNAVAVAELTMGLILALDRRIADNVVDARQGRWAKATYSKANGLLGSTLGILGMGSIGLAVAERAAGFGMRIGCLDRPDRSRATCDRLAELDVVGHRSLPELLASSDVVSLHLPSSAETRNLVDADFLAAMRPGSILVNTSRGDVVDEAALLAALDAGHVRAGLDVFADEPASSTAEWANPLARHPRVVATHHIGASTAQAQAAIAAGVVEIVDAFAAGEARNCVNLAPRGLGSATLTVRHLDKVGVLARVLELLREAGLNVEHMQNRIFTGGDAAVATIDLAGTVPPDLLAHLEEITEVLGSSLVALDSTATERV